MTKIYILKPSKHWSSCGGGRVVVANSWEEVVNLFFDDTLYMEEPDEQEQHWNTWVYVDSFEIKHEDSPRIILDDYNWA